MTLNSDGGGTIVTADPTAATEAAPLAQETQTAAPQTEAAPEAPDWRKLAAGEDADFYKQLERFSDLTSFAQSWRHAQQTISSGKRLDAPQADWGEEQWGALYDKLGRPKDPSGYKVELKLPDGVELPQETQEVLSSVTQAGHKLGLTPQQMQGVHEFVAGLAVEQLQQSEKAIEEQRAAATAELKKLWGREYDTNLNYAKQAANQLQRETGVDWRGLAEIPTADGALLGDRPEFVRLMAAAGRALGTDPLLEEVRNQGGSLQALEDEYRSTMALMNTDTVRYNHPDTQRRLQELTQALVTSGRLRRSGASGL